MVFSISKKLMLAFLGLTLFVLVATLGLARWSFERGFLEYVNALEQHRLETLATALSLEYSQNDHLWEGLSQRRFQSLMRDIVPLLPSPDGVLPRRPPPPSGPPDRNSSNLPKADIELNGTELPGRRRPPPPRQSPAGPADRAPPDFGPPTGLFDAQGEHIAGVPEADIPDDYISVPVLLNGETVGELRSAPRRFFESPQETAFSRQQWVTSLLTAVAALILALLVSLFLTRILLAPIRRMMQGVSRLSGGDYRFRHDEQRHDELGQLMKNLDTLALKLEENRSSRQRWLADISHELRTPVTVLTGEIETMKDGIRPLDMEQIRSLDQEVSRLRHLIEDLYELSLSDIGGLRYSFVSLDIGDVIKTAINRIENRSTDKGLSIHFAEYGSSEIQGDEKRLEQLFVNLLENSLAYTDAPGQIDVAVDRRAGMIEISIEDTPPGVTEDDCKKLFDPLYRQDQSRSRHSAGAGLGLSICRNIVIAHQGTISASPAESGGLRVVIKIPRIKGNPHG